MMYKTLYTAAITDFDRAYSLIGEDKAPRPSELPKEEHSAQSIKEQIASGNMQKAKIMQLENMQIHAVEATKAMAFMHGGDDAVSSLETSLNKGGTLAESTQEFLKNSGDTMLESLGISGEQMTNGSGKRVTELLSNNGAKAMVAANNKALEVLGDKTFASEADQRKHLQDNMSKEDFADYEKLTEFLMQVREEQTVPDALNLFGSVTTSKKEEASAPALQTMDDDTNDAAASAHQQPRSYSLLGNIFRHASSSLTDCFNPDTGEDNQDAA